MTVVELNALESDEFVAMLGGVFEHSPWVAERVWLRRPFHSREELHEEMMSVVEEASDAERLALLRAHPDLGARARMSESSVGEQRGAGLDRLTPAEFARLHELNAGYRAKFGVPFILAVTGRTKEDVLSTLERRLGASKVEELGEAMRQVYRIAEFRLEQILGNVRERR
jgi:2-oxo-4-hydroxy-4-carboxy-5-ureidoimidazoline decarboxylase